MKATTDGGAAFPNLRTSLYVGDNTFAETEVSKGGMTLRDYFAGQALVGLAKAGVEGEHSFDSIAGYAYEIADFMLRARGVQS